MRRRLLTLLLAVLVSGVAGCGGEDDKEALPETVEGTTTTATTVEEPSGEGDPAAGKEVFASAGCGSCHVLSDAGASGAIGPNLDESQPDFELTVDRVTNGRGAMPSFSDELSEDQIDNVAAYVVDATSG